MGLRHLIHPAQHLLTKAAERAGLEYLVAAWLYLHFRMRASGGRIRNWPDDTKSRRTS